MGQEIELKLELSAQAAAQLEGSSFFRAAAFADEGRLIRQRTIYFDTPDHALARAGFSLRIRCSGTSCVQTIKSSAGMAAGLFSRQEWEWEVDGETPQLGEDAPLASLPDLPLHQIMPLFTVHNERRRHLWMEGQDEVEIVLDRARVVAGEREISFCELELEQKQGQPACLFALAREVSALVPARLGITTKAGRGYELLAASPFAVKAETPQLDPAMTVDEAFRDIAFSCLRHFRRNEDLLLAHHGGEALHQARVALRRLRSAFSIFRGSIADERLAELAEGLRWLAGQLADARDLDVMVGRLGGDETSEALLAARDDARMRAREALESTRARLLMLDLAEWLMLGLHPAGDGDQPLPDAAAAILDRLRRKVRKKGRHLAERDDAARHALRKQAKKLRYATDFFATLYDGKKETKRLKVFLASLEALQDDLGLLNDLATAPDVGIRLGLMEAGQMEVLARAQRESKADLIEKAARAYAAFADAQPFW